MKVFGNCVLIEQRVEEKISNIMLPGGKKAQNQISASFKVLQVGAKVEEIQVGDIPIFGKHVDFHGIKVIHKEATSTHSSEILHVIVFDGDILGADDAPVEEIINTEIKE